jgi:hypothetical protein
MAWADGALRQSSAIHGDERVCVELLPSARRHGPPCPMSQPASTALTPLPAARLIAILAADAAGYSRRMAIDDRLTVDLPDAARAVFRQACDAQQGRVVDMAGNSVPLAEPDEVFVSQGRARHAGREAGGAVRGRGRAPAQARAAPGAGLAGPASRRRHTDPRRTACLGRVRQPALRRPLRAAAGRAPPAD